jgi:protein involved in polysaccharide export with SLBB domain
VRLCNVLTTTTTVCAIAGLCACSPAPPPPPPVPVAGAGSVGGAEPYRIQPGDVLGVRLLLNPDLNEDVVVRPDGHMSTTIVKDERAGGRTVVELADALSHDYTSIIRNPRLTVELKAFSPTRIYVGGEVNKPGETVTAGLAPTLSQAIARAGGLKAGDRDRVFIIRRGPNDVPQLFSARLRDAMRDQDPDTDVRLAQYDVVYVPREGITEVYKFLNENFAQVVPLMWGFSYASSVGPETEADVAHPEGPKSR